MKWRKWYESLCCIFVYRVFCCFGSIWEIFGHTSYRKQSSNEQPKSWWTSILFRSRPSSSIQCFGEHGVWPLKRITEWQGTIYSSFQRQVIDIQNAKTGHHGKVKQYIKKDCATWKCNMKGNWWNHGNTAEWGEHNFPSLVLGTVCKLKQESPNDIIREHFLRTTMEKK